MNSVLVDQEHRQRTGLLAMIAVISVLLWQFEIGRLVLYPFTILATWFHEMGHGIAAMLAGSKFDQLLIFPDGSGVAQSWRPTDGWRITDAFIAASGPMGPALAGAALIISSRTRKSTRNALTVLGAALLISTLIWVRSVTGWLVLPALGFGILLIVKRASSSRQQLCIQILGVQACISSWNQIGYLFSSGGMIGGQLHRSDTGAIADALLLPYWFWGGAISIAITALLWWSLARAFRP